MAKKKELSKKDSDLEDDYVPSASDGDDSGSEEVSGTEEEEEEDEDEEDSYGGESPPPQTPSSSKVKPTIDLQGGGGEVSKKVARKKQTVRKTKKKEKKTPVEKVTLKRKAPGSDFEVVETKEGIDQDMSVTSTKYPRNKLKLDDRHFMRVGSVAIKSKGITFEQLFIGRDPVPGEVTKDGKPPRPFQLSLPLKCLKPLFRGAAFILGKTDPLLDEAK